MRGSWKTSRTAGKTVYCAWAGRQSCVFYCLLKLLQRVYLLKTCCQHVYRELRSIRRVPPLHFLTFNTKHLPTCLTYIGWLYWRCRRSIRSRRSVTIQLQYACPIDRQQQLRPTGLLPSALRAADVSQQLRAPRSKYWRSAANAGSVTLRADGRDSIPSSRASTGISIGSGAVVGLTVVTSRQRDTDRSHYVKTSAAVGKAASS